MPKTNYIPKSTTELLEQEGRLQCIVCLNIITPVAAADGFDWCPVCHGRSFESIKARKTYTGWQYVGLI